MLTAIIGFDAVIVVYIHIGVGFGVARFDKQAMPEPQNVGRVTGRFPRFFISVAMITKNAKCRESLGTKCG